MFLCLIQGKRLEFRHHKGGISRLAPRELALPLQSLPPILHMRCQNPIPGYSKGARGLSVQSRVSGIFTAATVSPSSCRRQQSSRYTIRAGRNFMCVHDYSWHRLYVHLIAMSRESHCRSTSASLTHSSPSRSERSARTRHVRGACPRSSTDKYC